jgi:predicted O-methyltransferase YrrM
MTALLEELQKLRPATMEGLIPRQLFAGALDLGYDWCFEHYTWYFAIAKHYQPKQILEIGVSHGLSMISMLLGAPEACADGWDIEAYYPESNQKAVENLSLCGLNGRAWLFHIDSQKISSITTDPDMIHIDGDHSFLGAMHDFDLAIEAKIPVILFDDMFNTHTECKEAGEAFLRKYDYLIRSHTILPTQTGLLVAECNYPA